MYTAAKLFSAAERCHVKALVMDLPLAEKKWLSRPLSEQRAIHGAVRGGSNDCYSKRKGSAMSSKDCCKQSPARLSRNWIKFRAVVVLYIRLRQLYPEKGSNTAKFLIEEIRYRIPSSQRSICIFTSTYWYAVKFRQNPPQSRLHVNWI